MCHVCSNGIDWIRIFRWNYILGAFAAGGAIGMWQNCTYTGWSWGIAFGNCLTLDE